MISGDVDARRASRARDAVPRRRRARGRQSPDAFLHAGRRRQGRRRRLLRGAPRRNAGRRRRVRLRQERHRAFDPAARRQIRPAGSSAAPSASRAATCSTLSDTEMENIRGNDISMIFQEPMTSLNPLFTVGRQITRGHRAASGSVAQGCHRQGHRDAAPGLHPRGGAAGARLIPTRCRAACASAS